ncbi:Protein SSO2 [Cyberlindnera jadinii]|uniref:Protein SSO2 n=1 Tax=Cyberlindnera jadinii (strain ATCC 18201 / CBS 1600 / BCRC 20928 / JCM 3617 / NBRC 0987 / NRRL Y-1542) TaxID=983966 RepID=A0A0H5C8E2_CYBJN|nr:Protein SSO2 [Cyberlindnera jadinii]
MTCQYGYDNSNPYQENPYQENHELNDYNDGGDDFVNFMNNIASINNDLDNYNQLVELIEFNQRKLLTEVNEDQELATRKQLDSLVAQASSLQQTLKSKIKDAQATAGNDSAKKAQAENSRQRFLKYIQDYRVIEANYREENKQQAARQYKIVRPDATDAEVDDAINDVGGQQIFSQAIMNASRRGEAKTALAEVQSRHKELQKLEKTMAELTQLFHDMEEIVAQQNVQVENIDTEIEGAQKDIEMGLGHTDKAVESARKARRKKCWCYSILALIIIIIIVVIVVPIATHFS